MYSLCGTGANSDIVIILYMWFFYTVGLEFDINLTVYLGDTNL